MSEPRLNIVSFRYNPGGLDETALDDLNARLGAAVIEDGRFLVGTSKWGARTIFRPAFANWRTRNEDVEALAEVVTELGAAIGSG
jgi:glutamate/tyrosine decarboxylase-like PLP-dependent enzyme